ncbi:MAG TPA: hypothetical protein VFO19_18050, partial [Vicinamibacterales bacterium]|nr:hypothetical protein [Vicinamibacterales bacterium]
MRIVTVTSALTASIAVAAAIAAPAAAQQDTRQIGGVGITVYEDPSFGGRNATFRSDISDLSS